MAMRSLSRTFTRTVGSTLATMAPSPTFISSRISEPSCPTTSITAVCTENFVRVDGMMERLSWRNDWAALFRSGRPGLAIQVEVTALPNRKPPVIPLFGQNADHSLVPAKVRTAVARSGGPGRPSGRRVTASPWTAREYEGRLAISRGDAVHRGDHRIIAAVERCGACRAGVAGHTLSGRLVYRSLRNFCQRGVQALCRARTLDTRADAHRKRRQTTSAVVQGSHGADANHAKDPGRIARSISSRRRSLRSARQYSGRCRLHSRAP